MRLIANKIVCLFIVTSNVFFGNVEGALKGPKPNIDKMGA